MRDPAKDFMLQPPPGPPMVEVQVRVPEGAMGHVIGRGGSVIKAIASASGARLSGAGPGKDPHVLVIRGTAQQVTDGRP